MPVESPPTTPGEESAGTIWRAKQDLDPAHFHERVDGGAPALVALGCRRLVYFRLESPPADLEVLVFTDVGGARAALARDAGDARSSGLPGDEAWANDQCVFFRRGDVYVRLIADDAQHTASVRDAARRVARALARKEILP